MKKILAGLGILLIPLMVMLLGNWRMEAYYNEGNACYERGEYPNAIGKYEAALKWYPLEKQECSIRINLALSIIGTIDFEHLETFEDTEAAIAKLNEAKQVLLVKGCAVEDENGSGHSKKAQELKEDIDEMIKKLQESIGEDPKEKEEPEGETKESEETEESEDETEESGGETEESLSEEEIQHIEEQLDAIEQEGSEARYDSLQEAYEWSNGNGWYYYDGMSW